MRPPNIELDTFCKLVESLGCSCTPDSYLDTLSNNLSDAVTPSDLPIIFKLIFDSNNQAMLDEFNQFSEADFKDSSSEKLRQATAECDKLINVPLPAKFFLIYILKRFYMECEIDVAYTLRGLSQWEKLGAKVKYNQFALECVALTHMRPYLQHIMKHMRDDLGFPDVPDPQPIYKKKTSNSAKEYRNSGDDPDYYSKYILSKMLRSVLSTHSVTCSKKEAMTSSVTYPKVSNALGKSAPQSISFGFSNINSSYLEKIITTVSVQTAKQINKYITKREQGSCLDCLCLFQSRSKQYKLAAANLLCLIVNKLPNQLDSQEPIMVIKAVEFDPVFSMLNLSSSFSQLNDRARNRVMNTVMSAMTSGFVSKLSNHSLGILENPTQVPNYDQTNQAYVFHLSQNILDGKCDTLDYSM